MAADEFNTAMSATLRFPFQASLDGTSLVETDGDFYYGLDTAHDPVELPIEPAELEADNMKETKIDAETNTEMQAEMTTEIGGIGEEDHSYKQQYDPRWDSLVEDEKPQATTSRPLSLMPHRIATSDIQKFATEHEMAAEKADETEETEQERVLCESPASTIDPPTVVIQSPLARGSALPRFYSTPIAKDDPSTTPVLLYGLERPTEHVPRSKKLTSTRRPRSYYSAAPASSPTRPSSKHGPSLLSSVQTGIPEEAEPSLPPSRRSSVLLIGRSSPTFPPPKVTTAPAEGSTYSSGSASTTSTVRSIATLATEDSNYAPNSSTSPASSTSSSPTLEATGPPKRTPTPPVTSSTLSLAATSPTPPPAAAGPIRRTTASSNMSTPSDAAPVTSHDSSRRASIFNFNFRKFSPMTNRSFMRSNETLSTIRAFEEGPNPDTNRDYITYHNFSPTEPASRPMPFSPDSFDSFHSMASRGRTRQRTATISGNDIVTDTIDNDYNDTTPRPHTSSYPAAAAAASTPNLSTYRNFSKPRTTKELQPQSQLRSEEQLRNSSEQPSKPKKTAGAAHRATRFLKRVLINT